MTRHIKMMLMALLVVAMAASPCIPVFAEGMERCRMGDCDEPQVGTQASCCCASPASPTRSVDPVSTTRTSLQNESGKVASLNALPDGRIASSISASIVLADSATASSPDLFLLHSVFLI